MDNENIKEILDRLKDSATNPIVYEPVMGGVSEPIDNSQFLEPDECKILLDYITNLQEENKNLKLSLKDRLKYSDELDEKISRIDKAVEYIENDLKSFLYSIEYKTLLNILNSGDE